MILQNLKETWDELDRGQKISIIGRSHSRRVRAFNNKIKRKSSKKKKKSKRKSKKRKTYTKKKSPKELAKMKEKMSPEEWENFKMMVLSSGD